jgi:hypothetical protein
MRPTGVKEVMARCDRLRWRLLIPWNEATQPLTAGYGEVCDGVTAGQVFWKSTFTIDLP